MVKLVYVSRITLKAVGTPLLKPSYSVYKKLYIFVAVPHGEHGKLSRVVDLDIDIGADAVDYKYVVSFLLGDSCQLNYFFPSAIANQESLSALETEMRKLEGLVKEVVDEMGYLKTREQRFTDTNCAFHISFGTTCFSKPSFCVP